VNLSLKRVSKGEEKKKMNVYRREQRAEKILEQTAKSINKNLNQAYEEVGFLLQEKFGNLFTAFEEIRKSEENLDKMNISDEWKQALKEIIKKTFKEKEIFIKAELELKTYVKDGIEKIKNILTDISEKTGAKIKYISAPKYRVEVLTKNPKMDEKKLKESLELAIKEIKNFDGEGNYKFVKS